MGLELNAAVHSPPGIYVIRTAPTVPWCTYISLDILFLRHRVCVAALPGSRMCSRSCMIHVHLPCPLHTLSCHLRSIELTNTSQSGCQYCIASHRRHVMGVHHSHEEESTAKLRPAVEQHPRRAGNKVHAEAPTKLQSSLEYVLLVRTHTSSCANTILDTNLLFVM